MFCFSSLFTGAYTVIGGDCLLVQGDAIILTPCPHARMIRVGGAGLVYKGDAIILTPCPHTRMIRVGVQGGRYHTNTMPLCSYDPGWCRRVGVPEERLPAHYGARLRWRRCVK